MYEDAIERFRKVAILSPCFALYVERCKELAKRSTPRQLELARTTVYSLESILEMSEEQQATLIRRNTCQQEVKTTHPK